MMKAYIFFTIIGLLCVGTEAECARSVDIPKVQSIGRGKYELDLRIYNGGLLSNLIIGFSDTLSLGLPVDTKNAVGTAPMRISFPPIVHVQFIPLQQPLLITVGYFEPSYKEKGAYKENLGICGCYLVFSKSLLFKSYQIFAGIGGAMDLKKNYAIFSLADVAFHGPLHFIVEGIHTCYEKNKEKTFVNLGISYEVVERFVVTFALHKFKNRTLTLSYKGTLF